MAERDLYLGTVGPLLYDDTDTDTYPDSEATCALRGSQIYLEDVASIGRHAVRKTEFDAMFASGVTGSVTVITNSRITEGGALEVRTKQLTFASGILTSIGTESAWTATPL